MNDNSKPGDGGEFERAISGFIAEVEDDETSGEWVSPLRLRSVYFPGLTAAHAADLIAATEQLKREIERIKKAVIFGLNERNILDYEGHLASELNYLQCIDAAGKRIAALEAELQALKQPSEELRDVIVDCLGDWTVSRERDKLLVALSARENALKENVENARAISDVLHQARTQIEVACRDAGCEPGQVMAGFITALKAERDELKHKADQYDSVVRAFKVADGGKYRSDTIESCIMALQQRDEMLKVISNLREGLDEVWEEANSPFIKNVDKIIAKYEGGAK